MSTKVIILGSGTCVPSLKRSACSVLIETSGIKLLMDCGIGVMRRLTEAGVSIHDISYIFLSHFHPDHTGELASFLFSNKYPNRYQRKLPLTLAGGKGFLDFFNRLSALYGNWIEFDHGMLSLVEFDTISNHTRKFDGFMVETAPTNHNPESIAYKIISDQGDIIVYSGDTDVCSGLIDLSHNADLLICESATPDAMKVKGHLTPSLAGKIASMANVRQLILTHFYPECDQVDIVAECRKTFSGNLILAQDLMTFYLDN